jgi:hypothetical protein
MRTQHPARHGMDLVNQGGLCCRFPAGRVAQLPGPSQILSHFFGVSGQTGLRINNAKPCLCLPVPDQAAAGLQPRSLCCEHVSSSEQSWIWDPKKA